MDTTPRWLFLCFGTGLEVCRVSIISLTLANNHADDLQQELIIPRSPSPEARLLPPLRSDAARSNQARLASLKVK